LQFLPSSHPSISALSAVNAMPLGSCRRGIVIDTACANGPNFAAPIRVQKEAPAPPKLLDRVRQAVRMRHYSRRTEEAYTAWIRLTAEIRMRALRREIFCALPSTLTMMPISLHTLHVLA
jgi:hypothetical protein